MSVPTQSVAITYDGIERGGQTAIRPLGETMTKKQPDMDVSQMFDLIRAWLRDLNPLLGLVEDVLSRCHSQQDASSPLHANMELLRPLIRQCRAQIPNEEMVLIWLRMLAEKHQP